MNAPAAAPVSYVAREGSAQHDREAVLALWRGNLGDDTRMAAKFDWFYRESPLGEPLLRILHHGSGGPAVGIATAGPRRLCAGACELRGGVLVDLAVLPEHRTLGPALVLQQALIEAAAQRFDLVYGLPNPKAAPVFKRVGYKPLGAMVRYARVLRHARYLARRLPRLSAKIAGPLVDLATRLRDAWRWRGFGSFETQWLERIDERIDAMPAAKGEHVQGVRDAAFLRWRFERGPHTGVRYLLLSRHGILCAWFACHVEDDLLHVADFRCATGTDEQAAIATLLRVARRAGHTAVSVQIAAAPERAQPWWTLGFVARSQRPLFGRWFDETRALPLFLTAADEDE